MASISIELDKRTKYGCPAVRLRISNLHTTSFINTGVLVDPMKFTGQLDCPIDKKYNMVEETFRIEEYVYKVKTAIATMTKDGTIYTASANDIRAVALGQNPKAGGNFIINYEAYYATKRPNTRASYIYGETVLLAYLKVLGKRFLSFEDIDYAFVKDFEAWMLSTGKCQDTCAKILSYIRAAYNEGLRRLKLHMETPFIKGTIKRSVDDGPIQFLSKEGFVNFLSMDLSSQQGVETLEMARDIAMISFYLCGANLIDIYNLEDYQRGVISFIRSKMIGRTKKPVLIHVEPELEILIEKYKGKKHVFNFCERYKTYETFRRNLNGRFCRLSKLNGENVDMAIIRRTWATYAGKLEIADRVIDKSLGHKDNTITGRHYAEYDWSRTTKANRQVIDYALEGVVPNSVITPAMIR